MWQTYNPGGHVYFLSETNWTSYGCTYYYSYDIDPLYYDYGNGYIPYFAVIGGEYKLYYSDNSVNFSNYLEDAIASLGFADFESNIQSGPANLGVQFQSTSSGNPDSWLWNFGDGETSNEENPYHLYTDVGNYDVSLKVWCDADSNSITMEDYISVTNGNNISGNLSGVWEENHNPYNIVDNVTIKAGDTLRINSNVDIYVDNDSKISVDGKLVANGSDKGFIEITSNNNWKGIEFSDNYEDNLIQNCHISKANECVIYIEEAKVDIIGNQIFDNTGSTSKGTAITIKNTNDVLIQENTIANNTNSLICPGIKCDNASPMVTYNIIVNNTADFAGAFALYNSSSPTIINNTIANNEADYAAFWLSSSSLTIKNCIIIDSEAPFQNFGSSIDATYSCISGGYPGMGNIDDDPLFVSPTPGDGAGYDGLSADWSLSDDSPCIDAGDPDPQYNDPDGTRNDMGALYHPAYAIEPEYDNPIVLNQNYPNPFNSTTEISFSISKKYDNVHLVLYNTKGEIVKEFKDISNCKNASVTWNGRDNNDNPVSNGVYFYKLYGANYNKVKKLVLMK